MSRRTLAALAVPAALILPLAVPGVAEAAPAATVVASAPASFTAPRTLAEGLTAHAQVPAAFMAPARPPLTPTERARLHRLHLLHLRTLHVLHLWTLANLRAAKAAGSQRARVVKAAERYIGQWYSYGNLDCSGLTQRAYSVVGRHLPRTAAEQGRVGRQTARPQPGDLVVWSSRGVAYHVGVYVGRSRAVVARKTGTRVGIQVINWGNPTYRVVLT